MDTDEVPQGTQTSDITWYIGTAAEDLPDGSIDLKVYCPQLVPAGVGGTLTGADTPLTVKGTALGKGAGRTDNVESASTVICTYYGSGDLPLAMPPKVRKGESIEVRQYDTSNTYYWRPRGANNDLRKVDALLLNVGATPSIGDKTPNNSYCCHIDPLNKRVTISTSQANGEVMGFNITLDGQTGDFAIVNSEKNFISILKNDNTIVLCNKEGASVTITGKKVSIVSPEDVLITAKNHIVMKAKRVITHIDSGEPRHTTAYEDFYKCMEVIKQSFDEVQAAIGYAPRSHARILPTAQPAKMDDDEGK